MDMDKDKMPAYWTAVVLLHDKNNESDSSKAHSTQHRTVDFRVSSICTS
eukprot:CAMPEP_0170835000 /NCGR_PEP_ID=MMETSP0734-20130129/1292_1 /TAXON_ID=186038 /ORGANISM="Fragilariopsis kerguelensis, Strain L26-C5" /LENGTH=48 /DNA_ID= /DNA_START= /DNA_END= /DNA_ORIENTATION=